MNFLVKLAGVLGFILACVSLFWQIWTHHQSRKEDVRGTLSLGGRVLDIESDISLFGLFLDIWNNGSVPVYIKSVALGWGEESTKIGATFMGLLFQPYPKNNSPLQSSESRLFVLEFSDEIPFFEEAIKQTDNKVWVSVKSSKGEILRIKGSEVMPLLRKLKRGKN